ncbi:hypothetical protein [Streptomyces ossamyceticus]|uniref:hypothetical protein n=1 Tax=Streptomyces ossamyceticus TaxID=249581 RepID=UPI0034170872
MAAFSTPPPVRTVGGGASGTGGGTAGPECGAAGGEVGGVGDGEAAGAASGEAAGAGDGEAGGAGDGSGDSARSLGVESAAEDETTADTRRHGHDAGRAGEAESPLASAARPLTLRGADGEWNSGGGH